MTPAVSSNMYIHHDYMETVLGEHFGNMEDPRRDQGKRHQFLDIIAIDLLPGSCSILNASFVG